MHVGKQEASNQEKKRKQNTISIHVIGMALLLLLLTMFLQEHITSIVIKNTSSRNLFIFLTPLL
jgi:hypothetical protein